MKTNESPGGWTGLILPVNTALMEASWMCSVVDKCRASKLGWNLKIMSSLWYFIELYWKWQKSARQTPCVKHMETFVQEGSNSGLCPPAGLLVGRSRYVSLPRAELWYKGPHTGKRTLCSAAVIHYQRKHLTSRRLIVMEKQRGRE